MFLSVSGDFSFSHSFLKYLQGKTRCWHLDFSSSCSWEETLGIISQLLWRGVTQAMPGYFLQSYLFFLRKKKSSCGRLWQNAFHNSLFSHVSAPFGLLQVLCVPLGGFGLFFSAFKPHLSHLTLGCISCVLLAQTSGALMVVSQKSSHQKAVSVVWNQSAASRWGRLLTLWQVSDTTHYFWTHQSQMWWLSGHADRWFCCSAVSEHRLW